MIIRTYLPIGQWAILLRQDFEKYSEELFITSYENLPETNEFWKRFNEKNGWNFGDDLNSAMRFTSERNAIKFLEEKECEIEYFLVQKRTT